MKQAHTLREYQYYDKDTLCSIIDADFTTKQVRVENKVDSILDTAFGVNTEPTWDDFLEFLASRCIPKPAAALATTLMQLAYRNMTRCSWWKRHRDGWRRITNGSRSSDIPYQ